MSENKCYTPQELLKRSITMEELKISDVFTEEDIKFNRRMVDEGMTSKAKINHTSLFKNRNCNYIGEIVNEFRRKWGISERVSISIPITLPNRHIMYKRYIDGDISEAEYKTYLTELEKRERKASERFNRFVKYLEDKGRDKK